MARNEVLMPRPAPYPTPLPEMAERLRVLRIATSSNQTEFCHRVGMTTGAWNNYERGRSRIGLDAAMRLREKLRVPLDWIYFGDDNLLVAMASDEMVQAIRAAREVDRAPGSIDTE